MIFQEFLELDRQMPCGQGDANPGACIYLVIAFERLSKIAMSCTAPPADPVATLSAR